MHLHILMCEQFTAYLNMLSSLLCFEFYLCLPPGRVNRTLADLLSRSKIGNRWESRFGLTKLFKPVAVAGAKLPREALQDQALGREPRLLHHHQADLHILAGAGQGLSDNPLQGRNGSLPQILIIVSGALLPADEALPKASSQGGPQQCAGVRHQGPVRDPQVTDNAHQEAWCWKLWGSIPGHLAGQGGRGCENAQAQHDVARGIPTGGWNHEEVLSPPPGGDVRSVHGAGALLHHHRVYVQWSPARLPTKRNRGRG